MVILLRIDDRLLHGQVAFSWLNTMGPEAIVIANDEILSNEIDENSIEVYDESKNVFNPISINDYATFAKKQKEMVAEEAIENGLLSEAATKTQDAIKKYLNAIPNINENYTIEVKFLETKNGQ